MLRREKCDGVWDAWCESGKHHGRHNGMMNVGQNSQRSFDAQPCEEAVTRLKRGGWSGGFIGFGAQCFAGRKRRYGMVRDMATGMLRNVDKAN